MQGGNAGSHPATPARHPDCTTHSIVPAGTRQGEHWKDKGTCHITKAKDSILGNADHRSRPCRVASHGDRESENPPPSGKALESYERGLSGGHTLSNVKPSPSTHTPEAPHRSWL